MAKKRSNKGDALPKEVEKVVEDSLQFNEDDSGKLSSKELTPTPLPLEKSLTARKSVSDMSAREKIEWLTDFNKNVVLAPHYEGKDTPESTVQIFLNIKKEYVKLVTIMQHPAYYIKKDNLWSVFDLTSEQREVLTAMKLNVVANHYLRHNF